MRSAGAGQQRARLRQVSGDEDDEDDLEELAGLDADRPEVDPQLRPVDLVPEEQRGRQHRDAEGGPRVLVVTQDPVVAQPDGDGEHRDDPDRDPEDLRRGHAQLDLPQARAGKVLRQPVEHHDPDAADGADRGEQELIATVPGQDEDEMGGDEDADVDQGEREITRLEASRSGRCA